MFSKVFDIQNPKELHEIWSTIEENMHFKTDAEIYISGFEKM